MKAPRSGAIVHCRRWQGRVERTIACSSIRLIASGSWAISKFLLCQSGSPGHPNLRRCAHFVDDLNQPVRVSNIEQQAHFENVMLWIAPEVLSDEG